MRALMMTIVTVGLVAGCAHRAKPAPTIDPAPAPAPVVDAAPAPAAVPTLRADREASTVPGRSCVASWYGEAHRGLTTASGAPFDPDLLTTATWDHPFGARLKVTYAGRTVVVEVTDRGPARRLGRCLDLSRAAFERLAPLGRGLIRVTYEEVDQ